MSPIYESETRTREDLEKIRKANRCKVCGGWLNMFLDNFSEDPQKRGKAFIACNDWPRTHHDEGIEKEATEYEKKGMEALNINTRRKIMDKEFGIETIRALAKYQGVVSLTKEGAREVITKLWPKAEEASPEEVFKAITICTQYGLNPLMGHLDLIPHWNSDKKRYDYVCVLEIKANRLIASRKHHWTFLDDTPRISTEEEEIKHYRKMNPDKLRAIAKMRDLLTGAEVTAWGEWPKQKEKDGKKIPNEPKGIDKGNSMENMACIHAERKGLDMLYPADMPSSDIPVMDEDYIDSTARVIDEQTGEITEPEPDSQAEPEKEAEPDKTQDPAPKAEKTNPKQTNGVEQGKVPKTVQELMQWAASHGKNFGPTWVWKQANVNSTEEIKDVNNVYLTIKQITDWD